jgi:hypothetical protein
MDKPEKQHIPQGNQLPLPTTFEEAKEYFRRGPLLPLHYDTSGSEAVARDESIMQRLGDWFSQIQEQKM